MQRALVSLGANLGDAPGALRGALRTLELDPRIDRVTTSGSHASTAIGGPAGQAPYLNAVVSLRFAGDAAELLAVLQRLEARFERQRGVRWGPRTLDADLLLLGDVVTRERALRVPHPRMTFRPFVLAPALEVAADWPHPECGRSLGDLHATLGGGTDAVALVGPADETASWIAQARPGLRLAAEGESATARLTVDCRPNPWPLGPSGPRLVLADCPPEHWRQEVQAALDCVWPPVP